MRKLKQLYQYLLNKSKALFTFLQASLQALYENIPSTYTVNNIQSKMKTPSSPQKSGSSQNSPASILSMFKHASATKRPSNDQPAQTLAKRKFICVLCAGGG